MTTPIKTGGTWSELWDFLSVNCGWGILSEFVIFTLKLIIDASDGIPLSLACIYKRKHYKYCKKWQVRTKVKIVLF